MCVYCICWLEVESTLSPGNTTNFLSLKLEYKFAALIMDNNITVYIFSLKWQIRKQQFGFSSCNLCNLAQRIKMCTFVYHDNNDVREVFKKQRREKVCSQNKVLAIV